jgi:hypothetical protein
MIRTLATAALGWLGINTLGVLTLAAHSAWTSRRDVVRANRQRYTAEALAAAQRRHPASYGASCDTLRGAVDILRARATHNHPDGPCPADCIVLLEALYLAPAAGGQR